VSTALLSRQRIRGLPAQCAIAGTCVVLWVSVVLLPGQQAWCVAVTLVTIALWAEVRLHKVFRRTLVVRRALKFVPYAVPGVCFGIDLRPGAVAIGIAVTASVGYLVATRRRIQTVLDPRILALMPRADAAERWSETLFYAGSAVAQEYLHRFVLVVFLSGAGVPGPLIVVATTATFVLEHFIGPNGHTARSRANIALWGGMGIVFGAVAVLFPPALSAVMLGHLLVNAPAAIRPHLRGRRADP